MGRVQSRWHWLAGLVGPALLSGSLYATPLAAEHPDIRVIIDVSGSMRHNDPEQLAADALELLVELLPGGASAGVWTFGERVANPLPLSPVNDEWRERAMGMTSKLVDYEQFTDIEAAIRAAAEPEADGWRHLVLLTDGMIDLPPWRGSKPQIDRGSRRTLLEDMGPRLANDGVAIHAIAFSDEADLDLVERLARQTGGLSALVASPDALLGAFLNIVDRVYPADRVPLTDSRFLIEPGLKGFTALLFREEGAPTLIAPDGRRFTVEDPPDGARWRSEPRYDLIQVPDPMPGQWQVEGDVGRESRITISSPLTLQSAGLPGTLYLGFDVPVEAWLARDGAMLEEEALPGHLRITAELRDESGATQSAAILTPQEGRFVGTLPAPALTGTAQLVLRAEGQGFRRQRSQAVNVMPAVTALHDEAGERVLLAAEHPALDHDNTRLHGQLQGERLEARPLDERRWELALPELDRDLSQPLLLRGQATLNGQTRELRLPQLMLFPEGPTGIDRAELQSTLDIERFHEELSPIRESHSSPTVTGVVERFVALVDKLPQLAQERWDDWRPVIDRRFKDSERDPLLWGVGLVVVLCLLAVAWSRRHRQPRTAQREEPHV
ncbi:VWA domain-containing protein [Billgrantia endophytica]|uniref:VWFA domain-containing protein n=1 Tax=Billgrantia endophytica TaxID=2033802 RepID=A0A2N7TVR0_9GAMM|nr:VWA domain-containing protein [Halomonas endophytica]PMR72269.1 hypothetical protein C1H69_21680 [Halomonas endophytica]